MKPFLFFLILMCFCITLKAQTANPDYNKALADSLGADDYGMKTYVLVILKSGTNKTTDKTKVSQLFRGHLDNIGNLAKEGKLVVAGPLGKNEKSYRGIFILNVKTIEEAKKLLQTDPAVKEKLLDADLYEWYGSAALPAYLEVHRQIEKQQP